MKSCKCGKLWMILTIIGALNWGLIGIFGFNLVTSILGDGTMATKIVYIVIGVAAILSIPHVKKSVCDLNK